MRRTHPLTHGLLVAAAAAAAAAAVARPAAAFTVPVRARTTPGTAIRMSNTESEVEALLAAAAKARQDAERLRQELGQTSPAKAAAPVVPAKLSPPEVQALIPAAIASGDWTRLAEASPRFGSANLRTFPLSLADLERRTSLTAAALGLSETGEDVNLDDFKYATLGVLAFSAIGGVAALALLPPNVGATVTYGLALLPVLFLALGSSAPGIIAGAIKQIKEGSADASGGDGPSPAERAARHEAAHFCCGYWCGLPVAAYDAAGPAPRVEFRVGDSGERYSAATVAALAVAGLAGLVAEAIAFGNARGASQDLMVLDGVFRQAKDFYGAQQQQDLTRWAAFSACQLLTGNQEKYEQVCDAFRRKAPLEECIGILEA